MKIRTTLNLEGAIVEAIGVAAEAAGVDRNGLVMALVRRCAADAKKRPQAWKRVKYQERKSGDSRRRMHVALSPDGYEFSIDLRKVMKLSVSFIVAYAVEHYLDEVLSLMINNGDNYACGSYAMLQIDVDDVICWVLTWGIPGKTLTVPL